MIEKLNDWKNEKIEKLKHKKDENNRYENIYIFNSTI